MRIKTTLTRILSARGSQIFPHSLTHLYFLAKYPSSQSVNEAKINNSPAINQYNRTYMTVSRNVNV
jgi:hypothetical protein